MRRTIGARHEVPLPEGLCPKGAGGLSPGFQPWEPCPEGFALKGRQIERTNNAKVGPIVASQLRTLIFGEAIVRVYLVTQPPAPSGRTRSF